MKPLEEQENMDAVRKKLYERGTAEYEITRHELSDNKIDVARNWDISKKEIRNPESVRESVPEPEAVYVPEEAPIASQPEPIKTKPKRHYRGFLLSGSFIIFIIVAAISSLFIYLGGNKISSDNIQVAVEGPSSIGGGEVFNFEVKVSNDNSVPIESATLILKYPSGTVSTGDSSRDLYEERIPIDDIAAEGEINVPVSVLVYGEEHAKKEIEATIEYRVNGSNGMFYKDAQSLAFRITSTPLVLRIENIEKVASGQTVDFTITAASNASAPLNNIVITASYPNGFTYESSSPAPIHGQNVWQIDELDPEEEVEIKVQGVVKGLTDETLRINFEAGTPNPDNQYLVGSALTSAWADYVIERPFIDVEISIDGDKSRSVVLEEADVSSVKVNITNTLDETVYDMVVEVVPEGNALDADSIVSSNGFYDSNEGTVRWEVANNSSFDQILPGDSRSLEFRVEPNSNRTTTYYNLVVNVYARRVAESSAIETLIGTISAEAIYSSSVVVESQATINSGPVPPVVGQTGVYTLTIAAQSNANNVSNAIVETSLPTYINWLDKYSGDGTVTYNPVSKKIQWDIGDLSAGERRDLTIEVNFTPSASQVSKTPTLLNEQNMRANDEFTGALLQDTAKVVTTELSRELGYKIHNGIVEKE